MTLPPAVMLPASITVERPNMPDFIRKVDRNEARAGRRVAVETMSRPFTVIMLAGALQPSRLQQQLKVPLLSLPMGSQGTLLGAWLTTLGQAGPCAQVRIVVNGESDGQALRQIEDGRRVPGQSQAPVTVIPQPASLRGTGGLLFDLTRDMTDECVVMVIEAHCLPPASLGPLLALLDDGCDGVVGAGDDDEPAGVYAFHRDAVNLIPSTGYYDLKEQLFPALYGQRRRVRLVRVIQRVVRIRGRSGYLQAVEMSLGEGPFGPVRSRRCSGASISRSAWLTGWCVIEPDAVIEDGAVIHDSVVLGGAVVGRRAVVSRSIVGPVANVPRETRLTAGIMNGTARPRHGR